MTAATERARVWWGFMAKEAAALDELWPRGSQALARACGGPPRRRSPWRRGREREDGGDDKD